MEIKVKIDISVAMAMKLWATNASFCFSIYFRFLGLKDTYFLTTFGKNNCLRQQMSLSYAFLAMLFCSICHTVSNITRKSIIIIKSLIEKDTFYNYCDKETPRTLITLFWKKILLFHQNSNLRQKSNFTY